MHDTKVSVHSDQKQSTHRNVINSEHNINSNYIATKTYDNDPPFLTNYMQWQHINDAHETSIHDASYVKDQLVDEISAISSYESFIIDDVLIHSSPGANPNNKRLSKQLSEVRSTYHHDYLEKVNSNTKLASGNVPGIWPGKTTLIAGDSIISGIVEKRLCRKDKLVNARSFTGATIEDMFHYMVPLIRKRPDNIILHCGSNNTNRNQPQEIVDGLLNLKTFIMQSLPDCKVVFSLPTIRNDNPAKNNILKLVRNFLNQLRVDCISNENITLDCLGKSKLHLNAKGTARLAINYKSCIKHL